MAVATALGGMFWMGFRFGSILCVTPFLVLAIGVDDGEWACRCLNRWLQFSLFNGQCLATYPEQVSLCEYVVLQPLLLRLKGDFSNNQKAMKRTEMLEYLMVEMMIDTGPSISITTITNFLAFMIGILTPTPEIQLFSIGNATAIVLDWIYQWSVFGSFMILTGRWELREHDASLSENGSAQKIVKPKKNSISIVHRLNLKMKIVANK